MGKANKRPRSFESSLVVGPPVLGLSRDLFFSSSKCKSEIFPKSSTVSSDTVQRGDAPHAEATLDPLVLVSVCHEKVLLVRHEPARARQDPF